MTSVGLVTCRPLPEPDPDEALLLEALTATGLRPALLPWRGGDSDPERFSVCVLRSCWDYHLAPDDFLGWLERADRNSCLLNPIDVVRWNMHKGYLDELEAAGVPVVPTAWSVRGEATDLGRLMARRGWTEVVVKPAIGAGSFMTRRFVTDQADHAGQSFMGQISSRGDVMIQPYMGSVETAGERALVWIDGEFTHHVVKRPRYHGQDELVTEGAPPDATDLGVAERALACVSGDLLYARVDLIDDDDGVPLVSELELIEPSLFLLQHRSALDRLVAAIARYV